MRGVPAWRSGQHPSSVSALRADPPSPTRGEGKAHTRDWRMHIPLRRIGIYCVAFLFAIVVNFAVPRLMPGSPVDGMIAQLGPRATPAAIEAIKARFGAVEQPI